MSETIIHVEKLRKSFVVGDGVVEALKGIDLSIYAGEFLVIFGPSGCGKTTLLSMLAGLDSPTEGTVCLKSTDLYQLKSNNLARYRRNKIGMVFQQFNLVPTLTAVDNVAMPLILSGVPRKEAHDRAKELLETVGIGDRIYHKPSEMSGGQQQRVAIARALSANPSILLVDEPTGNLDGPTGREIMVLLKNINMRWGRTVILVTHNPEYVMIGDRVVYMSDGKVEKTVENKKAAPAGELQANVKYYMPKRNSSMSLWETMRISRLHFLSKRLRTFLTTLGVSLGVGSIVTLVSLGIGLQKITSNQLASLDTLVTINVSVNKDSVLQLNDDALKKLSAIPDVTLVSPLINFPAKSSLNKSTAQVLLYGVKQEALGFEGVKLIAGDKFKDGDGIILSKASLKNFDISDPADAIGKKTKINLVIIPDSVSDLASFKNVETEEVITGISSDEVMSTAYIPLEKALKLTSSTKYSSVRVKVDDRKKVEGVRDVIEKMGFATTSVVDLIKQVDKVFLITQIILGVIGGVALIVALIGIVNIMTISLLERTHEVGIMKAIGATDRDIKRIFEYEVLMFGFFGSVFGVGGTLIFGSFINFLISYLMKMSEIDGRLDIFVTPLYFCLEMIVVTVLVSLLAGWYPAKRASKLSPMEALRYE